MQICIFLNEEGNWGVLQAVERLSEWTSLGTNLQAKLFMGKKKFANMAMEVSLSRRDNAKTISAQWDSLRYVLHCTVLYCAYMHESSLTLYFSPDAMLCLCACSWASIGESRGIR